MGLIRSIVTARFWDTWLDRFESNKGTYITPRDQKVLKAANKAKLTTGTDRQQALSAWDHIYSRVGYRLSKEWKTPRQTLQERVGDCEDVTFLAASMLPHMGVYNFDIAVGDLIYPNGDEELHTWVQVGDLVVDPTGSPKQDPQITYNAVKKYNVTTE